MWPDAVIRDRMLLIGPKSGQLGPIHHCLLEEFKRENERIFTQDCILILDINRFQNRFNYETLHDQFVVNFNFFYQSAICDSSYRVRIKDEPMRNSTNADRIILKVIRIYLKIRIV